MAWTEDRIKLRDWKPGCPTPMHVERKYDGYRTTIFVQDDVEHVVQWEKRTVDLRDLPLWKLIERARFPGHTMIDGELYLPGGRASDVPSLSPKLHFVAFAIPFLGSKDIRSWPPQLKSLHHFGLETPDTLDPAPVDELLGVCRRKGWEGVVLKEANYHGWWRAKVTHTVDAKVIGVEPGYGLLTGMVGALIIEGGTHVGGLPEHERYADPIGRTVEVEYQNTTSKGRLQHARFVRWRDDK